MPDREVVALHPGELHATYGPEVHHRIQRDERASYARTARALAGCAEVVSIQHDFAIWGGADGEAVLDFVDALTLPASATLHAIPGEPTTRQREILERLRDAVSSIVVMSRAAGVRLAEGYGVDPARISVIPHGVPDLPLVDAASIKPAVELEGRDVILSFGLLSPSKNYELMLEAMPAIVAARPAATYVIVGATRPEVAALDGEAYRTALAHRVAALGLADHVRFVDRFVGRVELTRWLESADVLVTPYHDTYSPSGALSYALGAGRAVVSTPFPYAAELLADGRGVLVPFADPAALAAEVVDLLRHPERRLAIGQRAYDFGRSMVWTAVGTAYQGVFGRTPATPSVSPGAVEFRSLNTTQQ
jgi:glycosyltransferase involved in cell wall biosynthesis